MKLFVYGTLKYPEIVKVLTGKSYVSTDAKLENHRVIGLKNKPYPGLIHSVGYIAEGKLLDVDEKSFKIIEEWEDIEYSTAEIVVNVDNSKVKVLTFLHISKSEQLGTDWDEENFRKNNLQDYVVNRIPDFLKTATLK